MLRLLPILLIVFVACERPAESAGKESAANTAKQLPALAPTSGVVPDGQPGGTGNGPSAKKAVKSGSDVDVKTRLRSMLQQQAADWSAGKLEEFCNAYADDAIFISPTGLTKGRTEIFERYRKRYQAEGAEMGKLSFNFLKFESDGDLATVMLEWNLEFQTGDPASGRSLIVLRQGADGWRVTQDASM